MRYTDFTAGTTRRTLLKQLGAASLAFRASPLHTQLAAVGHPQNAAKGTTQAAFEDFRVSPNYPLRSPLEDVFRLVQPGSDGYITEKHAAEIKSVLDHWSQSLKANDTNALQQFFHPLFQASSFVAAHEESLRSEPSFHVSRKLFSQELVAHEERFLSDLHAWIGSDAKVEHVEFEIYSIHEVQTIPLTVQARVRYDVLVSEGVPRRQMIGSWNTNWERKPASADASQWQLVRWQAEGETVSVGHGPLFADVTEQAFGAIPSYKAQMLFGADHWRSVLDSACGIDIYGNNGISAGDYNNDGHDDLYVSQPAGLPNRLYRNRGDGTFEDVTDQAGVGVLDHTSCALFADFRNKGVQDLLVVCGSGPILFLNQGNGTFSAKKDAFQFRASPQGTFTHAAIADYDLDGRLDIYFCVYSYYLGLDQYHYPVPYFDARNGPPNFLFHNEGDGLFTDRTAIAGLDVDNNRYSFACAWGPPSKGRSPDLYVVNDFGRNVLYRSNGNGTFTATSEKAQVEDVGAGMSACWANTRNNGLCDLYAANMWSAAGKRVSEQAIFHPETSARTRQLYRTHADGSALYRNKGDDSFENASVRAGVNTGRWAWCSDFWDFDHDGYCDLYVANGYITSPNAEIESETKQPDLGSFFWRQIVGRSPNDASSSQAYEHGWNALNELIRSDYSWSGRERNVLFANNHDGSFSELSGIAGLDFLEDSRSFALADIDGDGRLEVILKNRNAPQLRVLKNVMTGIGESLSVRLVGTSSNPDAIGTAITVQVGALIQKKYLQSGTGFLAQHTKDTFFGLGLRQDDIQLTLAWPSGLVQQFQHLPRNSRLTFTEGSSLYATAPFRQAERPTSVSKTTTGIAQVPHGDVGTWLIQPLQAPTFQSRDVRGNTVELQKPFGNGLLLLYFYSDRVKQSIEVLKNLVGQHMSLKAAGLNVIAINTDTSSHSTAPSAQAPFPVLVETDQIVGIYNIIYRYLFDRRHDLPLPSSFLLDSDRKIVKVYQGALNMATVRADLKSVPQTTADRLRCALPFYGVVHQADFARNDFTYGVAMFQRGYLEQAEASFQQVVTARPDYAEGYYNLGTLKLQKKDYPGARDYLQRTLQLRPDYAEAWNNLGMIAAQEGHTAEAITSFERSTSLKPSYAIAWLNLGNALRKQGNHTQAEDALIKAQTLLPDDAEINYSLGLFYAQQGVLDRAQTYLERALEIRPAYPEALNNLGVLYVRRRDYPQAETRFKRGIELVPDFQQSYENLARLYAMQNKSSEARQVLGALLKIHPENDAAKRALQSFDAKP